jgi:hypothetical protein
MAGGTGVGLPLVRHQAAVPRGLGMKQRKRGNVSRSSKRDWPNMVRGENLAVIATVNMAELTLQCRGVSTPQGVSTHLGVNIPQEVNTPLEGPITQLGQVVRQGQGVLRSPVGCILPQGATPPINRRLATTRLLLVALIPHPTLERIRGPGIPRIQGHRDNSILAIDDTALEGGALSNRTDREPSQISSLEGVFSLALQQLMNLLQQ